MFAYQKKQIEYDGLLTFAYQVSVRRWVCVWSPKRSSSSENGHGLTSPFPHMVGRTRYLLQVGEGAVILLYIFIRSSDTGIWFCLDVM